MDNNSDLMWQRLQARLDQRFGKYFKSDERQRELNAPEEKSPQDINAYKIKFTISYLSERIDD
jgi:hypothetical protein